MSATAMLLNGERLHLQHGPIDLIVMAEGPGDTRHRAFSTAVRRFETVLSVLVDELDLLRKPVTPESADPLGPIARRMMAACRPHAGAFVTPMAAVAGAVADEVLAAMVEAVPLTRAAVNNGGDIALHLAEGHVFKIAIQAEQATDRADIACSESERARLGAVGRVSPLRGSVAAGDLCCDSTSPIRGIATSGRGGRSLSLGIADAVTVLARSAAEADVAATLIANAVDLPGHLAIRRAPANTVRDDSDLGDRLVVTACAPLSPDEAGVALDRGAAKARRMQGDGLIEGAALFLQGEERTI